MANEPIAPTQEDIKRLQDYDAAAKQAGVSAPDALGRIKKAAIDMASGAKIGFEHLTDFLEKVGDGMKGVGESAGTARLALTAIAGATLNARDSFHQLGNVDYGNMNTLSDQMKQLKDTLGAGGSGATAAKIAISGLFDKFKDKLPESALKAFTGNHEAMASFVENMARKADNITRMQAGLLAVSAATGNLGQVYKKAGADLSDINSILSDHQSAIRATIGATRQAPEAVEKYYMALGHVPGALQAQVSSGTAAGENMNMLTAVMKMAAGNGRTVEAVTQDLGSAFKSLGMTGEPALKFVNRFSELSSNLGVQFDDMKNSLLGATDAFKNITDAGEAASKMTEGMANNSNKWISSLMGAHMSGRQATETYKNMASAMAGMTTAQKSFLSAQTGGPGGLLGGLQIEKMMRSGDTAGVQKKLMEVLQKQTGPITTMDEALKGGQAGAARFEKQRMMITQGPMASALGIKSSEDAAKMLEAMKAMQEGRGAPAALAGGSAGLQDAINKGTSIEDQNHTELTDMNKELNDINTSTDILASGFSKSNFGIEKGKFSGKVEGLAKRRQDNAEKYSKEGGKLAGDLNKQMGESGRMKDPTAETHQKIAKGVSEWIGHLPDVLKAGLKPLQDKFATGKDEDIGGSNAAIKKQIEDIKKNPKSTAAEKANAELLDRHRAQAMTLYSGGANEALKPGGTSGSKTFHKKDFAPLPTGEPLTAAELVAQGKHGTPAAKKSAAGTEGAPGSFTHSVTENGAETGTKIHVTVKVDKTSDNARSQNPAPRP